MNDSIDAFVTSEKLQITKADEFLANPAHNEPRNAIWKE